jgi:hypothetical protein
LTLPFTVEIIEANVGKKFHAFITPVIAFMILLPVLSVFAQDFNFSNLRFSKRAEMLAGYHDMRMRVHKRMKFIRLKKGELIESLRDVTLSIYSVGRMKNAHVPSPKFHLASSILNVVMQQMLRSVISMRESLRSMERVKRELEDSLVSNGIQVYKVKSIYPLEKD